MISCFRGNGVAFFCFSPAALTTGRVFSAVPTAFLPSGAFGRVPRFSGRTLPAFWEPSLGVRTSVAIFYLFPKSGRAVPNRLRCGNRSVLHITAEKPESAVTAHDTDRK